MYVFSQGFDIPTQAWNYSDFSLPNFLSDSCISVKSDPNSSSSPEVFQESKTAKHPGKAGKNTGDWRFNNTADFASSGKSMRRKPKSDEFRQHRDSRRPFMYRRLKLQKMVKIIISWLDYYFLAQILFCFVNFKCTILIHASQYKTKKKCKLLMPFKCESANYTRAVVFGLTFHRSFFEMLKSNQFA